MANIKIESIHTPGHALGEMLFIYDKDEGIMGQDSSFLSKVKWSESKKSRSLLLNYHHLTIYRYRILNQVDTVLAQYLIEDENEELMRNTFYYYESINTHDSSLSKSISRLMASKLEDEKLSYDYFMDYTYMDLKDLHYNITDGLHINQYLPKKLGRVRFRFKWRKTLLEIFLEVEDIIINKISGPSTEVILGEKKIIIGAKVVLFNLDGVLISWYI